MPRQEIETANLLVGSEIGSVENLQSGIDGRGRHQDLVILDFAPLCWADKRIDTLFAVSEPGVNLAAGKFRSRNRDRKGRLALG